MRQGGEDKEEDLLKRISYLIKKKGKCYHKILCVIVFRRNCVTVKVDPHSRR